ncbi:hypothetical protein K7432_002590 [Basidiobolus ranarum]|uniref:MFS general substrate transporter n=1 Tax=Basidiobolus ranarum TaxID=34480 RepID=A0ABR2X1B7_9FUNG
MTQVLLVGFVCFCCPGMFNVISGMGGAGLKNPTLGQNGTVALYTTFAVFGVFGGSIYNVIGGRWCLFAGGITYALYTGSLLFYTKHGKAHQSGGEFFVIFASAILGIGAGVLWTAEGVIMMSYPSEDQKGRCVGYFWIIFNLGGVIGAFIPLGLNFHSTSGGVSSSTYIAFMCIMIIGGFIGLLILPPEKMVRNDGSRVEVEKFNNVWTEIVGILKLFLDKNMLLLTPISISSNWFYSYQFNDVNGALFNTRTRAFNNAFYWAFQMLGAFLLGSFLDSKRLSRRQRALYGLYGVFIFIMAVWGGGLALQLKYTRETVDRWHNMKFLGYDFLNNPHYFWSRWFLYCMYGFLDAATQTYAYWLMGTLTNDSTILARYSGYYKGIQSAGAAISWRIDALKTPYMTVFIICWAILGASFPFTWVVANQVTDTSNTDIEKQEEVKPVA